MSKSSASTSRRLLYTFIALLIASVYVFVLQKVVLSVSDDDDDAEVDYRFNNVAVQQRHNDDDGDDEAATARGVRSNVLSPDTAAAAAAAAGAPLISYVVAPSPLGDDGADKVAAERMQAIADTWARQRAHVAYQARSETSPVARLKFSSTIVPSGQDNATDISRFMSSAVDAVQRQPLLQWLVHVDDVTYVLVENLEHFMSLLDSRRPYYLGHRLKAPDMQTVFLSAGAGIVLSRAALDLLVDAFRSSHSCFSENENAADVCIANCLKKVANLEAADTRDEQGRERFHAFSPGTLLGTPKAAGGVYTFPVAWYESYRKSVGGVVSGSSECCAPTSVSFHYILPSEMHTLHAFLDQLNRRQRIGSDEFEDMLEFKRDSNVLPEAVRSGPYTTASSLPFVALRKFLLEHISFYAHWDVSRTK